MRDSCKNRRDTLTMEKSSVRKVPSTTNGYRLSCGDERSRGHVGTRGHAGMFKRFFLSKIWLHLYNMGCWCKLSQPYVDGVVSILTTSTTFCSVLEHWMFLFGWCCNRVQSTAVSRVIFFFVPTHHSPVEGANKCCLFDTAVIFKEDGSERDSSYPLPTQQNQLVWCPDPADTTHRCLPGGRRECNRGTYASKRRRGNGAPAHHERTLSRDK